MSSVLTNTKTGFIIAIMGALSLMSCSKTPDKAESKKDKASAVGSKNYSRKLTAKDCVGSRSLRGTSYRVLDGDTFKLKSANGIVTDIRLAQIDAPEKKQPWSNKSKKMLFALLDGKELCVITETSDRYGRIIGNVFADKLDANERMINLGGAWAYRKYLKDKNLLKIEAEARAAKRGLWAMPEEQTIEPWEYRKAKRSGSSASHFKQNKNRPNTLFDSPPSGQCYLVPRCDQFNSCQEALDRLARCGGAGIDGDGDGIPCEKMCNNSDLANVG